MVKNAHRAGVAQHSHTHGNGIADFEPGNSLLPEYSRSDWALTCAWLFASILLDMLLD